MERLDSLPGIRRASGVIGLSSSSTSWLCPAASSACRRNSRFTAVWQVVGLPGVVPDDVEAAVGVDGEDGDVIGDSVLFADHGRCGTGGEGVTQCPAEFGVTFLPAVLLIDHLRGATQTCAWMHAWP
jgi:hypothetical protein